MTGPNESSWIELTETREAWAERTPGRRLAAIREAARRLKDRIKASGTVEAMATRDLISLPYPTGYGLDHAALTPWPYLMMTNRMTVVQFRDHDGELRTLLANPSDYRRGAEAPFYRQLAQRYGEFLSHKVLSRPYGMPHEQLARLGLSPEEIDFITFDHLHIQDLRGWLGGPHPLFPRARLLVERREWEAVRSLHPLEVPWYVPGGCEIPENRVRVFDGDILLGSGLALISTTGHTEGNHTIAIHTPSGLCTISENGVGLDNYVPERSAIPGVAKAARRYGYEVLLNANTRQRSAEQYTSMVLEKLLADPCRNAPEYPMHLSSSEFRASPLFPGLSPTFLAPLPDFGTLKPLARAA